VSAKIVFSGGGEVVVSEDPDVVLEILIKDKRARTSFSKLSDGSGHQVHIAPEQVAFVGPASYGS